VCERERERGKVTGVLCTEIEGEEEWGGELHTHTHTHTCVAIAACCSAFSILKYESRRPVYFPTTAMWTGGREGLSTVEATFFHCSRRWVSSVGVWGCVCVYE
jgi:hypothetical protein